MRCHVLNLRQRFVFSALVIAAAGCGTKSAYEKVSQENDAQGWQITGRWVDSERGASATDSVMPESARRQREQEYATSALIPVPSISEFNTQLFQLKGVKEYENVVVVAPKVFAYGSQDKGKLIPRINADGTVTLTFNIAFTDGLTPDIRGADDSVKIGMSDGYLVHNVEGLAASAQKALGKKVEIRSMPGCAKEIAILASGTRYPVDISDLVQAHHCALNQPIAVSLTVNQTEAWRILQEDLHSNQAEVRAIWEVALPVSLARLHVELNRRKLFESLDAELGVKYGGFVDLDFRAKVRKVVRNQMLNISVEGDEKNDVIEKLVQMAIQEFATPWEKDDPAYPEGCKGDSIVCLRLNYENANKSDSISIDYEHKASYLRGERFVTWAKLKPLIDREAEFQTDNQDHSWMELGITVSDNDVVEILPEKVRVESRSYDTPENQRISNPVCLKPGIRTENRCHTEWQPIVNNPACLFLPVLCLPVPKQICQNEVVGASCDEYQDQFQEVTAYGRPKSEMIEVKPGSGKLPQLYTGLYLKFNRADREVSCPLSAFERVAYGDRIAVRIQNNSMCQPFEEGYSAPVLALGNRIQYVWHERSGREVIDFRGNKLESPTSTSYEPKVEIGGKVIARGYGFTSQYSEGHRIRK